MATKKKKLKIVQPDKLQKFADEITFSGLPGLPAAVESMKTFEEPKVNHKMYVTLEPEVKSDYSLVRDYSLLWIVAVVVQIFGIGVAVGIGIAK